VLADPGALAEAWTVPLKFQLDADTEHIEYVCNENERDRQHLAGKASHVRSVPVDPAFATAVRRWAGRVPASLLTSLSNTKFPAPGGNVKCVTNEADAATDVILEAVEGGFKAIRK